MPRKNGKNELCAALALKHLVADGEINGQVYSAAADRHADEVAGRPCYGGPDLGSTQDLTALVLVFPDDADPPRYDILCWFWTAGDGGRRERGKRDRVPYALWRDQGLLEATPGRDIDKGFVARRLAELPGRYDTRALAYNRHDRWRIEELRPPRGPLLELNGHHIGRVQGVA